MEFSKRCPIGSRLEETGMGVRNLVAAYWMDAPIKVLETGMGVRSLLDHCVNSHKLFLTATDDGRLSWLLLVPEFNLSLIHI